VDLRILHQGIARGELGLQDPARHLERRDALARRDILDVRADAPGQEFRIARYVIYQGEHLRGGKGDYCAALDYLHLFSPAPPPFARILRQMRARRHHRAGRIAGRALRTPLLLPGRSGPVAEAMN
jgi:hypothetical protein